MKIWDLVLKIADSLYNSFPAWFTATKMLLADLGSKDAIFLRKRVMACTGLGRL